MLGYSAKTAVASRAEVNEAAKRLRASADDGNPLGQYGYGVWLLEDGDDKEKAVKLIELSAKQGFVPACLRWASMLADGDGVAKSPVEARRFLTLASEQYIGPLNETDPARLRQLVPDRVPEWSAKEKKAAVELGKELALDVYARRVRKQGVRLWAQAAIQGHAEAQYRYALALKDGALVKQNLQAAAFWFKRAADEGHKDARKKYENSVREGIEAPKGRGEELRYMRLAEKHRTKRGGNSGFGY